MADPEPKVATDPAIKRALDQATLDKARADARLAAASASKAETANQTDQFKAMIGDVPSAGYSGGVIAAEGAAAAEQMRQAHKALGDLAETIADSILKISTGKHVYVGTGDAVPSRSLPQSFELSAKVIAQILGDALALSNQILGSVPPPRGKGFLPALAPLATAGLILSGVNGILSYFRSDYGLGGKTLEISERALTNAIFQRLASHGKTVWVAGIVPPVDSAGHTALLAEVEKLSKPALDARLAAAKHSQAAKLLTPTAPAPPAAGTVSPAVKDPDLKGELPLHLAALAALNAALDSHSAFVSGLLADAGGASGLQRIAEAKALNNFLVEKGAVIALVNLGSVSASTISKKGLLTTLRGSIPFKLSVHATGSWRCYDGQTLMLTGSGEASKLMPMVSLADVA